MADEIDGAIETLIGALYLLLGVSLFILILPFLLIYQHFYIKWHRKQYEY